jgi:hypothetical protein
LLVLTRPDAVARAMERCASLTLKLRRIRLVTNHIFLRF